MNAKTILEEHISQKLILNPDLAKNINSVCQLELAGEEGGIWTLDFTKEADWISMGEAEDPTCSLKMSVDDFLELYTGSVSGFELYTSQRLRVKGKVMVALKLNKILEK